MASTFTIIRNGRLFDLRRRAAVAADILIKRDVILTIGAPGMEGPHEARVIDASGRAMMPGLVNATSTARLPKDWLGIAGRSNYSSPRCPA